MAKTVLIVDDECALAEGCGRLLQHAGFEFRLAFSVEEAIDLLQSHRPAVVLSDVNFPKGQDGFDLAAYVRKSYPKTPVILMSGYHSPEMEVQACDAGATELLGKPFTAEKLISAVRVSLH